MTYKVFLSSPADVDAERDAFERAAEKINGSHIDATPLEVVRWEHQYYTADSTFQAQIDKPSDCDLVVCIFWKRLGSDLPDSYARADGSIPTGSEYEFEEALQGAASAKDKLPDVLVYRKTAKVQFSEENFEFEKAQRDRFLQFWRRWFHNEKGHFVAAFQSFADTREFETVIETHLRQWLSNRSEDVVWTGQPPYRGLAPFDVAHAPIFFGRFRETERARARLLTNCLAGQRFLLILGASGSGKSSMVRAGLIPRLALAGGLSDVASQLRWAITTPMTIRENWASGLAETLFAKDALARELRSGDFDTPKLLGSLFGKGGIETVAPVRKALERASHQSDEDGTDRTRSRTALLILLDQLEEIFAWPAENAQAFLETLLMLGTSDSATVLIVGTMRSDFQHRLTELPALERLVGKLQVRGPDDIEGTLELSLPGPADFREMIVGPARAAGLSFEVSADRSRDLRQIVENEASPGALPAFQFLLSQLYERRQDRLLTLRAYDELGGSGGVMATRGEEVLASVEDDARSAFPRVARALVTRTGRDGPATALLVPEVNLGDDTPETRLVDAFKKARLLTSDHGLVRIAHESLITGWSRLHELIEGERQLFESRDRLLPYFHRYRDVPERPRTARRPLLLTGFQLAEGRQLLAEWGREGLADTDPGLPGFIEASIARDRWKRRRTILAGWVIALVLAGLSYAMYSLWTREEIARRHSDASLKVVQSQNALREGNVYEAVAFAGKGFDLRPSEETRSALWTALMETSPHLASVIPAAGTALAWLDDHRVVFMAPDDSLRIQDMGAGFAAATSVDRQSDSLLEEADAVDVIASLSRDLAILIFVDGTMKHATRTREGRWDIGNAAQPSSVAAPGTPHGVAVGSSAVETIVAMTTPLGVAVRRCSPATSPWSCKETMIDIGAQTESVGLSPDARWLAVGIGGEEAGVAVYDLGADNAHQPGPVARVSLDDGVVALDWSATGDRLAAGTQSGRMILLETVGLQAGNLATLQDETVSSSPVRMLGWHPGEPLLAYTCGEFEICLRRYPPETTVRDDVKTIERRLFGHTNTINRLVWSPDGSRLASIADDDTLALWATNPTPLALTSLETGRDVSLRSVASERDSGRIAAGDNNGAVWLWKDLSPWAVPRRIDPPEGVNAPVTALAFASDGALAVVYADTGIGIVQPDGAAIERYEPTGGSVSRLAWVDGDRLVAAPLRPSSIVLVPRSGDIKILPHPDAGPNPASVIATPESGALIANYTDGAIWRWETSGKRAAEPIVSAKAAGYGAKGGLSMSIDPAGQWIAATRVDETVRLYHLAGGHDPIRLTMESANTKTVAFAPGGPHFAALTADGQITLWRVQGEASTRLLSVSAAPERSKAGQSASHVRRVSWIAWRDAQRLLTATAAGNILVLNFSEPDWRIRVKGITNWPVVSTPASR